MCKALEYTNELFNIADTIKEEWTNLHNKLSLTDKKISDIEHYIELSLPLNASQGYNLYKMLKEILCERRNIKNQIDELMKIYNLISNVNLTNPNKRQSTMDYIKNKHNLNNNDVEGKRYKVRVLTEIFGEVI